MTALITLFLAAVILLVVLVGILKFILEEDIDYGDHDSYEIYENNYWTKKKKSTNSQ